MEHGNQPKWTCVPIGELFIYHTYLLPLGFSQEMSFLSKCLKDTSPQLTKETHSFLQKCLNSPSPKKPVMNKASKLHRLQPFHLAYIETISLNKYCWKISEDKYITFSTSSMLFLLLLQSSHPPACDALSKPVRTAIITKFQGAKCVLRQVHHNIAWWEKEAQVFPSNIQWWTSSSL